MNELLDTVPRCECGHEKNAHGLATEGHYTTWHRAECFTDSCECTCFTEPPRKEATK